MDEFEEIAQHLKDEEMDYMQVDVTDTPVAINCSISGGMMIPNHPNCPVGDVPVLFISLEFAGMEEHLNFVVPGDCPLGHAILSGEFGIEARKRIEKFAK